MKLLFITVAILLSNICQAQTLKVFFGNLHSHTSLSDGSALPDAAYKHARDVAKIDFLAITEHNHPGAPSKISANPALYSGTGPTSLISIAKRFTVSNQFVAIFGQEFSSIGSGNHANVLEIDKVIQPADVPNGEWDNLLNDFLPQFTDPQGRLPILLLNHPTIAGSPNAKEYGRDDFGNFDEWVAALDKYACLINMVNGPSHETNQGPGTPSETEFLRYLNMGFHLAPTADQDNHLKNWGSAANTRTGVIAPSLTKQNIMNALRNRHVYATEDKNLSVIAKFNGELIGTRFIGAQVPPVNSTLSIEITIKDKDEPNAHYTIDVYRDTVGGQEEADVVKEVTMIGDGTATIVDVKYTGGNQYFFIKIMQTDEDESVTDNAWLAPIWFEPNTTDTGGSNIPVLTLKVNERTEEAEISNVGNVTVDLKNWKLLSTVGNQIFEFTATTNIMPGQSIIVTSGPNASTTGNRILWTTNFIWSNSGDPGKLINADGIILVSTPGN